MKKLKELSAVSKTGICIGGIAIIAVIIVLAITLTGGKKHQHTIDYTYEMNGDGTHTKTSYCTDEDGLECVDFEPTSEVEDCTFEDGICTLCGGGEEHQHTIDYTYEANGDGTHTKTSYCTDEDGLECKNFDAATEIEDCTYEDGKCTICGGEQVHKHTEAVRYEARGDGKHIAITYCTDEDGLECIGYLSQESLEDCTYDDNGVCTLCGFDKNAGTTTSKSNNSSSNTSNNSTASNSSELTDDEIAMATGGNTTEPAPDDWGESTSGNDDYMLDDNGNPVPTDIYNKITQSQQDTEDFKVWYKNQFGSDPSISSSGGDLASGITYVTLTDGTTYYNDGGWHTK